MSKFRNKFDKSLIITLVANTVVLLLMCSTAWVVGVAIGNVINRVM